MLLVLFSGVAGSNQPRIQLNFSAANDVDPVHVSEYKQIWESEGQRITNALEKWTGLPFEESTIEVIVMEAPSSSGFKSIPMRLRASYSADTKKATLIHELGHRLQGRLFQKDDEDHPFLFLYLYDVWTELYGKEFADQQVKVEKGRKGFYDYDRAWTEALAMTTDERKAKWKEFLKSKDIQKRKS